MKLYRSFNFAIYLIAICLTLNSIVKISANNKWCWTASMVNEPSYVFNAEIGGINWGYTKASEEKENRVKYLIEINTSNVPKSGTKSMVRIQIFGSQGVTAERDLVGNLEAGTTKKIQIEDKDVGDVNKLLLKIVGRTGYRCSDIKVSKGSKGINFECLKRLEPCASGGDPFSCQMEILPDGDSSYDVKIKTAEGKTDGTNVPILISLIGSKGISSPKMFSDMGLKAGSTISKRLFINDIGEISGYQLKLGNQGKWKPAYIMIKKTSGATTSSFDLSDQELVSPGKETLRYDSNERSEQIVSSGSSSQTTVSMAVDHDGNVNTSDAGFLKAFEEAANSLNNDELPDEDGDDGVDDNENPSGGNKSGKKQNKNDEGQSDNGAGPNSQGDESQNTEAGTASSSVSDGGFDINDPSGGMLNPVEKKNLIELSCTQQLLNPNPDSNIFGPDFPTPNVNYLRVLAKCPANCHKIPGSVFGMGLHPETSPICLSALIDNAISEYGGVISISVYPGLEKYLIPKGFSKRGEVQILSYVGVSKKSFSLSKVDNVDMIEKDIRILNDKGHLSSEGRLEMRIEGQWGTICAKRNNIESARRICKDLGYKDGKWAYPLDSIEKAKDFCRKYKGHDHCGSVNYFSIFSDLDCTPGDQSFNTCNKKLADVSDCGHSFDAIISCTNQNFTKEEIIPTGVVRLEKTRKDGDQTIGRMEFYSKGQFKPVCEVGFTEDSAQVACKQMGFDSGERHEQQPDESFKRDTDDQTGFGATELSCSGREKSVADCKYQEGGDCKHDQDIILKCSGSKGDITGKSQYKNPVVNPPPALGKLGMLKIKATCATLGTDPRLRGDPGSIYIIKCPKDCHKMKGTIWGTGLYTLDSNLCLAAIHAGIIEDHKGGKFVFSKLWGQKFFKGMNRNGIGSTEYNEKWTISFSLSKMNSNWQGLWKIWKTNMGGTYLEESSRIKFKNYSLLDKERSNLDNKLAKAQKLNNVYSYSSFLETGINYDPIYEWIEDKPSHQFSDKEGGSIYQTSHSMKATRTYTIIMRFTMTAFKQKKSFLFSYSGCKGFNIFLDENDNLNFGDPCSDVASINTNMMIALNDRTVLYVLHNKEGMKVVLFTEKNPKPQIKKFDKILPIDTAEHISIGRIATNNDLHFFGLIEFIQIYDDEIPITNLQILIDRINNKPKDISSPQKYTTQDNRPCVSPPIDGPTPGQAGSPPPPKEADPYAMSDTDNIPLPGQSNTPDASDCAGCSGQNSSSGQSKAAIQAAIAASSSVSLENKMKNLENALSGVLQEPDKMLAKLNEGLSALNSSSKGGQDALVSAAGAGLSSFSGQGGDASSSNGSSFSSSGSGSSYGGAKIATSQAMSSSYSSQSLSLSSSSTSVFSASYGSYDKKHISQIETMEIDCETNLRDERFIGSPGKIFRVKCPACQLINAGIYGSFIYHPLSSICKAAIHAGSLNGLKQGYIVVELLIGKKIYNGSIGKGALSSATFASSPISFKTKSGIPPMRITCEDSVNKSPFNQEHPGSRIIVICPENCSKTKLNVYGTEIYADMSPICPAAIHWGAISDRGGEVEFLIEGSQNYFKGTKGFGISSQPKDAYIRSFRFTGIKAAVFYRFKENFMGKLEERWKINIHENTFYTASNSWKFDEIRSEMSIVKENQQVKIIHHTGEIRSRDANNYGSFITLKNAQWANGRIRTNFMFRSRKKVAIMFRYMDKDNFYAVEFDLQQTKGNLQLVKKTEGSYSVVKTSTLNILIEKWYRMAILLNYDKISVLIQSHKMREQKLIFEEELTELSRGTIGFATNGNDDFYLSGIQVDDWMANRSDKLNFKNKRTWSEVLKKTSSKDRKRICQETYTTSRSNFGRCLLPHTFCKLRCDNLIPSEENIINFNCFKDCVRKVSQEETEIGKLLETEFTPKEGNSIDFIANGEKEYRPAIIKAIKKKGDRKFITVNYFDNMGESKTAVVKYPGNSVFKCGEKLTRRTDCLNLS
jgi:hypothetical protein